MLKVTAHVCLCLCLLVASASSKELGIFGATYEIAEKDFLQEIKERARQVEWSKIIDRTKVLDSVKKYRPNLKPIQLAKADRIFTVKMSHTLEFDIIDGKHNIVYPKGYSFNPLEFVNYDRTLVIINAADKSQVKWLLSTTYLKDLRTTLIITGGSYYDLISRAGRPVYYATPALLEKLRIDAVPSVATQKGNVMEIREIRVQEGNTK